MNARAPYVHSAHEFHESGAIIVDPVEAASIRVVGNQRPRVITRRRHRATRSTAGFLRSFRLSTTRDAVTETVAHSPSPPSAEEGGVACPDAPTIPTKREPSRRTTTGGHAAGEPGRPAGVAWGQALFTSREVVGTAMSLIICCTELGWLAYLRR